MGVATGRELADVVGDARQHAPLRPLRLNSALSTGCVRCRRLDRFGVVEPAVVDGQTAILGFSEHIRETMVPQYLVRKIRCSGVDRLQHRLVEARDSHHNFHLLCGQ